jgi:hypothetical protein
MMNSKVCSIRQASDLLQNQKESHHEQRSRQEEGFKERTGKNHEGKKGGQTREEK